MPRRPSSTHAAAAAVPMRRSGRLQVLQGQPPGALAGRPIKRPDEEENAEEEGADDAEVAAAEEAADEAAEEAEEAAAGDNDLEEEFDEPSEAMIRYASERHKRFYNPRSYRRVVVYKKKEIIGADLATMPGDSSSMKVNRKYRYIACYIDCFNRYAWAYPMYHKTAAECFSTFEKVIADNNGEPPEFIWTDRGQEYLGEDFKKLAEELDVSMSHTISETGSAVVERFIRSLKEILTKLQTERLTLNWVDLLPKALNIYNERPHSAIGMSPAQARKLDHYGQQSLWYHMFGRDTKARRIMKPRFEVGDWVVAARLRKTFEKRSAANIWSTDKYQIASVDKGQPPLYRLIDADGTKVNRRLYANELQHTTPPPGDDEHESGVITEILRERGTGKDKEYYVAWFDSTPSWVNASVITHKGLLSDWADRKKAQLQE